jgi:hypothetical protein
MLLRWAAPPKGLKLSDESPGGAIRGARIGDALVERGLVSEEQRDQALEKQCDLGGTLGASLLELGFIDEQDLGQALSELRGIRYATRGMLRKLKSPVRNALPRPLLWKHRVVPFRLVGNTLHLLVSDVRNLTGLSRKTGYRIVPWLAPEVRVHQELHRHFKIPLSKRYADIAEQLEGADAHAAAANSLREQLIRVGDDDEAVSIVLDYAAKQMSTCVLFRVIDGEATIWDVRGHTMSPHARENFSVPSASGSLLEILQIHPTYRGPVPNEAPYHRFFAELELETPREVILLPIKVVGQVVGILYGNAGPDGEIATPFMEQQLLARKLGLALTLILIRNKIRD